MCSTEVGRPLVHQAAPTLEEITARVGRFGGVLSRMGERGFDHLTRRIRLLRRPVPEARLEPMRHGGDAEFFAQLAQRWVGERLPTRLGEHHAGAIAQSLYVVQDRERPPRKRDAVIPLRLHARGGDGPDARVQLHFASWGASASLPSHIFGYGKTSRPMPSVRYNTGAGAAQPAAPTPSMTSLHRIVKVPEGQSERFAAVARVVAGALIYRRRRPCMADRHRSIVHVTRTN